MKNKVMQTAAGTFLAFVMIFGAAQVFVSGQERNSAGSAEASERARQSIEGTWRTTVTQRNCQTGNVIRTFRGLSTYHEGGTVSETSAALGPALRSPGHGVWQRQNPFSNYSSSFVFLLFSPEGTLAGSQKIISSIELGPDGNTYETTTAIQVYDVNDNLLGTGCATATATRFE